MKSIGNISKDAIIRALVSAEINVPEAVGSETVFESAGTTFISPVYDSNANKTAIFYKDAGNSNYGTAIVATVSGTSLSFGSPVVFESATTNHISAAFDSNSNKIVVAYADTGNSNHGTAIVGTVSGTSISFGSPVVFNAGEVQYCSVVFDSSNNKIVISYTDAGNSSHGTAIVGTVSGTSISFGSEVVFESASSTYLSSTFDSNLNKVVIAYKDGGNSGHGTAIVGTVSGTSISFGSPTVYASVLSEYNQIGFDGTNNKVVIAYQNGTYPGTYPGTAIVGTVSGTGISFGAAVVFQSSQTNTYGVVYDSDAQKMVIFFRDQASTAKGTVIVGTVSGTSISFNTKTAVNVGYAEGSIRSAVYDSTAKKVIIAYTAQNNSSYGTAVVYQTAYSRGGGTIADGSAVIVNANGTVSTVAQEASSTPGAGSVTTAQAVASGEGANFFGAAFDSSNNKVVIAWADGIGNTNYGKAVVGTVSGDSITFGTPVVFESQADEHIDATFDSNANKVVIAYRRSPGGDYGRAIVGTVSGNSISFGSSAEFNGQTTQNITAIFDITNNKVVITFRNVGSSSTFGAVVGTVSGTSISFGSVTDIGSTYAIWPNSTFDSTSGKVIVSYRNYNNSNYGTAAVGTVSGTSISFGTPVVFNSGSTQYTAAVYDSSNNKTVIGYRDDGDSSKGKAIVGTVSGTSISFGSEVEFATEAHYVVGTFDSTNNKVFFAFADSSYKGAFVAGTVSGTSISFSSNVIFENYAGGVDSSYPAITFDSNAGKAVYAFEQYDGSDRNVSAVVLGSTSTASTLTSENFVGFMDGAALDGTNGEILSSCSIARNQTSLTPGQTYFVSPTNGALSTTAGSPSVTAGTAISSTELIVKG